MIGRYALDYAARGWQAVVTVDDAFVRVVAVPERGVEPKAYVLGLLEHGFLADALPVLEALDGMLDDAEIAYNHGLCLSELGQAGDAVAPLQRAVALDPANANAMIALGVAFERTGRPDEAARVLTDAVKLEPGNAFAKRNLAAVLMRSGRAAEALPYFRQAASLAPADPGAQLGLAQCLEALGPEYRKEASEQYKAVVKRFPDHQAGEMAEEALTRIGQDELRSAVDGGLRMDAVMYMQAALDRFAKLEQAKVGQIVMEIALLGRNGLEINKPAVRYTLQNLEGEFSGLALLAYMHVGFRMFDPKGDAGTGLDREYEAAVKMQRKR
ncbi:tetratricopeptide repeat protein [Thauera sp. 2A1]|uniref:tetratricopeptide repeat protein n=1 Tax=Thauera sp. 2A1 TaxID=2570191 RepID=UPI001D17BF45|nr:tetratricopeptide repeat protein [Thauera sp. 2A1]KAI5912142.1 tetratricopeptide repeat protein [Thauera sp. 2A1]KAI5915131.1 tetratricopeptide repeat protein [Thauera sp. 2A1]